MRLPKWRLVNLDLVPAGAGVHACDCHGRRSLCLGFRLIFADSLVHFLNVQRLARLTRAWGG